MGKKNRRNLAWIAFKEAAENLQGGAYPLELVRHMKIFSAAPPDEHNNLQTIVMALAKLDDKEGVLMFGRELYDWAVDHEPIRLTV